VFSFCVIEAFGPKEVLDVDVAKWNVVSLMLQNGMWLV